MILRDILDLVREEKRKKARAKGMSMSILAAGVVSAAGAAGILFAPKSGEETRKWLKRKAVSTMEHIKHHVCKDTAIEPPAENACNESNLR